MRVLALLLGFSILGLGGGVNRKNKEGAELYRQGQLDEALAAFTQAQVESPDAPEIHYNIGNVHCRKEEMDKALEEYRAALKGEKSELQELAHYNAGNVHYRGQDLESAVNSYKQALKINPGDIEARQNLELALKKEQQQKQQDGGGEGGGDKDQEEKSEPQSQKKQDQQQDDQQQQDQPQREDPKQAESSQPDQKEISQEEAERILAALEEIEKAEQGRQQQKQKVRVRVKTKDW